MGRRDRERYEREKADYKGPWKIPDIKFPNAPKRPCSAFLAFSNQRRKKIVEENPHLDGTQISSALSKIWKECPCAIKQIYREKESQAREHYKQQLAAWTREKDLALSKAAAIFDNVSNGSPHSTGKETLSETSTIRQNTSFEDDEVLGEDEEDIAGLQAFNDIVFGKEQSWKCLELNRIRTFGSFLSFSPTKQSVPNSDVLPNHCWPSIEMPQKFNLPARASSFDFDLQNIDCLGAFTPSRQSIPNQVYSTDKVCQMSHYPAEDLSRFDYYSMDQILEDDELFEDFSPLQVESNASVSAMPLACHVATQATSCLSGCVPLLNSLQPVPGSDGFSSHQQR